MVTIKGVALANISGKMTAIDIDVDEDCYDQLSSNSILYQRYKDELKRKIEPIAFADLYNLAIFAEFELIDQLKEFLSDAIILRSRGKRYLLSESLSAFISGSDALVTITMSAVGHVVSPAAVISVVASIQEFKHHCRNLCATAQHHVNRITHLIEDYSIFISSQTTSWSIGSHHFTTVHHTAHNFRVFWRAFLGLNINSLTYLHAELDELDNIGNMLLYMSYRLDPALRRSYERVGSVHVRKVEARILIGLIERWQQQASLLKDYVEDMRRVLNHWRDPFPEDVAVINYAHRSRTILLALLPALDLRALDEIPRTMIQPITVGVAIEANEAVSEHAAERAHSHGFLQRLKNKYHDWNGPHP